MDLHEVERQRLLLEENLKKLKASLKHYQTLTAEYEGLSEEIQASASDLDLQSISESYAGDIVDQKEIQSLAGLPASPRSGAQVLDLISKRQEYVQLSIETLQRQFWDAEAKLEELDFAAFSSTRDHRQTALPLTEIHEELDEDGNVITSRLVQPEAATEKLVDTLRKAGLSDADLGGDESDLKDPSRPGTSTALPSALVAKNTLGDVNPRQHPDSDDEALSERTSVRKKSVSFTADTKPPRTTRRESEDRKRTVSFNDKVAVMPSAPPPDARSVSFAPKVEEIPPEQVSKTAPALGSSDVQSNVDQLDADTQKKLRQFMFKPGDRVGNLNAEDELTITHVVLPENESAEDAALRREMLEYHLNEVGHVVAQMDLDEDDYDLDENASSEYPEEDTPYTSGMSDSDRESEDEYGRSTRKVISDDYHKEMQELQQRLIGNLGPAPTAADVTEVDAEIDAQHVHRLVVQDSDSTAASSAAASGTTRQARKRVSFADSPSFAQEEDVARKAADMLRDENEIPLAEMVLERTQKANIATPVVDTVKPPSSPSPSPSPSNANEKSASLSTSTASGSTTAPETTTSDGPPGQTIADTLVERPTRSAGAVAPPSTDEQDPILQRRELAEEYYRRRNNLIRQQGGFKADPSEEEDEGELMEERDGKLKKVSRFRAARIK